MFEKVLTALETILEDWSMMQKTVGDEGAEWAERFETNFYKFINEFENWYKQLENKPETLEEAENLKEVEQIQNMLPGPLQLNFANELERIVDGLEEYWFD